MKGQRTTAAGKVVATLPTLYVKLQGEATIHLRAVTAVNRDRLVTTFPTLPDAPLSRFTLSIASGKNGIIEAVQPICGRKNVGSARFVGHNGKTAPTQAPRIATACAKGPGLRVRSARRAGRSVVVSGTIAKASEARVRVALRCAKTTLRASAVPRKGRWTAKVALKGACAKAKTGTLGASVRAQGRLGAQTARTRTVKLR